MYPDWEDSEALRSLGDALRIATLSPTSTLGGECLEREADRPDKGAEWPRRVGEGRGAPASTSGYGPQKTAIPRRVGDGHEGDCPCGSLPADAGSPWAIDANPVRNRRLRCDDHERVRPGSTPQFPCSFPAVTPVPRRPRRPPDYFLGPIRPHRSSSALQETPENRGYASSPRGSLGPISAPLGVP